MGSLIPSWTLTGYERPTATKERERLRAIAKKGDPTVRTAVVHNERTSSPRFIECDVFEVNRDGSLSFYSNRDNPWPIAVIAAGAWTVVRWQHEEAPE